MVTFQTVEPDEDKETEKRQMRLEKQLVTYQWDRCYRHIAELRKKARENHDPSDISKDHGVVEG